MSDAALKEAEAEVTGEVVEEVDPKVLEKAREMGWKPVEEWVGDTSRHLDAEKFIERNERLKERADGIAKAENDRLTAELASLTTTLKEFKDHYTKTEETAYRRAVKDLKAQQRKAVEEGDTEAFDRVEQEIGDLTKEATPKVEKEKPKPEDDPVFQAWKADNSWYGNDIGLTVFANQSAEIIGSRANAPAPGKPFFDAVTEAVKKEYPEKFENPNRRKAPAVEGAGEGKSKKAGKTYADLPPEAKRACDDFVSQQVDGKPLLTKEEYVKDYFEEE